MKKNIFLLFAFVMQTALFARSYFPEGTKWTEIRLDTLKYDEWYSKVEDKWVPNYEVIEYYVQGEYAEHRYQTQYEHLNHIYSCVYSSGPGWADSLTFFVNKGWSEEFIDWGGEVTVPVFDIDNEPVRPGFLYPFTWDVGDVLTSLAIIESSTTGFWPWDYDEYGTVEEIKEGYIGGVRPLKYSDVNGLRFIQTVGVTTWNDGECIFGPIRPYEVLSAWGAVEGEQRHYRSMLVHFERDGEVLYDVWPEKPAISKPVTFTQGQIATIILPTEPDASKGKYYRLDKYEDGQIIFEQELQPQAHIPYIIVPNEDFSIDLSTLNLAGCYRDTVSIAGISFIGSYVSETFDYPDGFYIDFIDITPDCRFDESCVIGALRAYLLVRWDDPYNQGGTRVPPLNKRGIVLRDYETGITSPLRETGEATLYDLQGRMLPSKPTQGIYIKNRQKVMVK